MVWNWAKTKIKLVITKGRKKKEDRFAIKADERRRHRERAPASHRSLVSFFIFVKYMSFFHTSFIYSHQDIGFFIKYIHTTFKW